MIAAVMERCVGVDIGKKSLCACVMVGPANGEARSELRTFATTVPGLCRLREWIQQEQCTHAIMESTGSYWKPVFNILEGVVKVALANPHEVKARKGHKTDAKDAWWLAHLLRHGMVTPSFIPPRPQRELRDLTRRRKKMLSAATSEKNRVSKVLEDANINWVRCCRTCSGCQDSSCWKRYWRAKPNRNRLQHLLKGRPRRRFRN